MVWPGVAWCDVMWMATTTAAAMAAATAQCDVVRCGVNEAYFTTEHLSTQIRVCAHRRGRISQCMAPGRVLLCRAQTQHEHGHKPCVIGNPPLRGDLELVLPDIITPWSVVFAFHSRPALRPLPLRQLLPVGLIRLVRRRRSGWCIPRHRMALGRGAGTILMWIATIPGAVR